MAFTPDNAQANMEKLIEGLQEKFDQLFKLRQTPGLSFHDKGEIDFEMAKLNQELLHRRLTAAFDTASATIIREPTPAEISKLQGTLELMGKDINSIATITAVIKFVEDVMTENAQRFGDILKTVST